MINLKSFQSSLDKISQSSFDNHAVELFKYQAINNKVYKKYLDSLSINPTNIRKVSQIPFLPIEFFKSHDVNDKKDYQHLINGLSGKWLVHNAFIIKKIKEQNP